MQPFVLWLDDIRDDDLFLVGGKALNLARLRRAGFQVPDGFVLTTALFEKGWEGGEKSGSALEARDCVLECYRRLGSKRVAVRSSGVVEDAASASFAGQGRTILDVSSEGALLAAATDIRRSLERSGTLAYARKLGVHTGDTAMAVVVQELVDADVSGVLFTENPVTGCREEMLVNATWGLGEPLVSGSVTPDEAVIDKATRHAKGVTLGGKEQILTPAGSKPADPDQAEVLCLGEELIRRLADLGHRVEEHFGSPQDVEWAWRERLYVLQARPLTSLPPAVPRETGRVGEDEADELWRQELERLESRPRARWKVWVAKGLAENLACPTPLSWEVASRFMSGEEGYGLGQRYLGFDPAPGTILERIAGHIYVDLERESDLFFRHAPIGPSVKEIQENPLRATVPRQNFCWRKLRPGFLVLWPYLIFQVAAFMRKLRRHRDEFLPNFEQRFRPRFESYVQAEKTRDLTALSEAALVELFRDRLVHFLTWSSPILTAGSILAAMSYRELEDLLIDRLGAEGIELAQQLTTGLSPNPALDMQRSMRAVASGEKPEEEFVREFGHRSDNEFELAMPRWREDRESLRAQLERLAETGEPAHSERHGASVKRGAEAKLDRFLRQWGRITGALVRSRLLAAQKLFPLREQAKDFLTREYELLRGPLVDLDRRLDLREGIFYLNSSEISALAEGGEVAGAITERRRQHALERQLSLPPVILGSDLAKLHHDRRFEWDGDRGTGVSPGIARGRVRVVTCADEILSVETGEILVTMSLEPSWTLGYTRAAGLVAERGAALSHGAIVARELGIPAVVNVPRCTDRLRTGQKVEVDGSKGSISVIE